jgi:hypothetical protein
MKTTRSNSKRKQTARSLKKAIISRSRVTSLKSRMMLLRRLKMMGKPHSLVWALKITNAF